MEANFVIRVSSLTEDFVDGIMKVFSKDAVLNITVNYELETTLNGAGQNYAGSAKSSTPGKKRGPKPKQVNEETVAEPKKRGRKPKVIAA